MLSFRENNPYFNSFRKDKKSALGVVTEEKPKHRKGTAKKSGKSAANTIVKPKSQFKSGAKANQKIRSDKFSIGGDSASLNSNMKLMKSPKFLAQLNSKNKRYNEHKENFNLPQLSKKRICF